MKSLVAFIRENRLDIPSTVDDSHDLHDLNLCQVAVVDDILADRELADPRPQRIAHLSDERLPHEHVEAVETLIEQSSGCAGIALLDVVEYLDEVGFGRTGETPWHDQSRLSAAAARFPTFWRRRDRSAAASSFVATSVKRPASRS